MLPQTVPGLILLNSDLLFFSQCMLNFYKMPTYSLPLSIILDTLDCILLIIQGKTVFLFKNRISARCLIILYKLRLSSFLIVSGSVSICVLLHGSHRRFNA
jgi:hypothetical protein